MPPTMLCVQFRNLLPSEDLLRFARALWETAQRDRLGPSPIADATLSITKTESKVAPFRVSLRVEPGSLQSVTSGLEPLRAIEVAFLQLGSLPRAPIDSLSETASGEYKLGSRGL